MTKETKDKINALFNEADIVLYVLKAYLEGLSLNSDADDIADMSLKLNEYQDAFNSCFKETE